MTGSLPSVAKPPGVRHVPMSDVAGYSTTRVDAQNLDEASFVGVDNLVQNRGGKVNASYSPNSARLTAYQPGDVLIGNIRPYLKKVWLAENSGGCSGDVLAVRISEHARDSLTPGFLYYLLSSDRFFAYNMQHAKGSKMPRGDKSAILQYRIPLPTLDVQRAVVGVLDTYTQLEVELETQLEAELEARRMQHAYLRGQVFDGVRRGPYINSTLGDICVAVSSGGTPRSGNADYYGGGIPWVRTQEVDFNEIWTTSATISEAGLANSSAKWIPENCVIVAMYGATAAKVAVNRIPVTTNQACCNLQIDPAVAHYRYVFHWLSHNYLKLKSLGEGSQSNLNAAKVRRFPIELPSLADQKEIAGRLDTLDALVSDISQGLPAEIAARRKQYEYYRDKLLTFRDVA